MSISASFVCASWRPLLLACCIAGAATASAQAPIDNVAAAYRITPDLFDPAAGADLGLHPVPGTQTFTVFRPGKNDDRFNNGVVLMPFKGRLYAQWQSSQRDEDSPDTWVAYSGSDDGGVSWTPPEVLAAPGQDSAMHSSGGWWSDGETLVAYINVWPSGFQSGEGGHAEYRLSTDGVHWSAPRRVLDADGNPIDGIIEQDPHALPGGRIVTAFHLRPGLVVSPHYTDDSLGITGWRRGAMDNLPYEGKTSRELEPSLFLRRNAERDCVVMVFRDQASSFRQLASESCDRGQTWARPAVTGMPDARAKQSAGNLPDGSAFLANAPNADRVRIPLALTLSDDGHAFTRSFLLRGQRELQPLRFEGRYKRPGYHYPKSVVWNGYLYVGYATNKEDVEVTRVPLSGLD